VELLKTEVSYLKGLIEGVGSSNNEKSAAVWGQLVTVCDRITDELESLAQAQKELADYVKALDEDLDFLEAQLQYKQEADEDDEGSVVVQAGATDSGNTV